MQNEVVAQEGIIVEQQPGVAVQHALEGHQKTLPPATWGHGICGCCENGPCWCMKFCCFCDCTYGRAMSVANVGPTSNSCCNTCLYCYGLDTVWPVSLITLCCGRQKLSQKYNIQESNFWSCLLACFCAPCSVCQLVHEVEQREGGSVCCCSWTQQ